MSPRRSAAVAAATRERLLDEATAIAGADGLEGVTIGRLAGAAGLSKSGVTRHFPTKEELQLETFEHAIAVFLRVVWEPVAGEPAGLRRLLALCDAWTAFLAGDALRGGCFLTAAAVEFDAREGPVREAVRDALRRWLALLAREVATAVEAGELPPGTDPGRVAYQLNALAMAANQARQLLGDESAPARSRDLMREALGAAPGQP